MCLKCYKNEPLVKKQIMWLPGSDVHLPLGLKSSIFSDLVSKFSTDMVGLGLTCCHGNSTRKGRRDYCLSPMETVPDRCLSVGWFSEAGLHK